MKKRNKPPVFVFLMLLLVTLPALFACESRAPYIGKYISENESEPGGQKPFIVLKEKGEGIWRMADEETPFSWNIKGDNIRLHVKPGGVITGQIDREKISIKLPGTEIMTFHREHPVR